MVRSELNRTQALVFFLVNFSLALFYLSAWNMQATTAAALLMLSIENDFPFCKGEKTFPYLSQGWLHV